MKFTSSLVASLVVLAASSEISGAQSRVHHLWKLENELISRKEFVLDNARLQPLKEKHLFELEVSTLASIEEGDSVELELPIVSGDNLELSNCKVHKGNRAIPAGLLEKFPDMVLLSGVCDGLEEFSFIGNAKEPGSLAGRITLPSMRQYYVDVANTGRDMYMIYDVDVALNQGVPMKITPGVDFVDTEQTRQLENNLSMRSNLRAQKKKQIEMSAYKFRIAMVANSAYSEFHGNTLSSVFEAMAVMMDRVNGLYFHELGVFFEFIERTDELICLEGGDDAACSDLSNDNGLFFEVQAFLEAKGVPYESFDIGHGLSTGSGGRGNIGSVCSPTVKTQGTTGLAEPVNDPFAIDYVAHEIGHQSDGRHSFRDCQGPSHGALDPIGAVEPGSAITIMSYAGLCGTNNLASNSEPHFDNHNLKRMRDFFDSIIEDGVCGSVFATNEALPVVSSPATCKIPTRNFFQLKGSTSSADADTENFYSWSRVDPGYEDFDSFTLGKFRHWKPTKSLTRFFPNLHFLNFPDPAYEKLEKVAKVGMTMQMRFMDRELYDTDVSVDDFELGVAGQFAFSDTLVEFVEMEPMQLFFPASDSVIESGAYTFKWSPPTDAQLADKVEILMAVNTLDSSVVPSEFDYEVDNKELDWVVIGEAAMTDYEALLTIPDLGYAVGENVPVNIMLRASELSGEAREQCFFFDLSTNVILSVVETSTTLAPTTSDPTGPVDPVGDDEVSAYQSILTVLAAITVVLSVIAMVMSCMAVKARRAI